VVYLILSWNQPTWVLDYIPGGAWLAPLRRLLMPVWEYVLGLLWVLAGASRPTFILGHPYPHGVWFYYPVLLVLKSPLGFLALLALGVAAWLLARQKLGKPLGPIPAAEALHWRVLWVALIVMTGTCVLSRLDMSIRHFSVPLALMILLLAALPATLGKLRASMPRTARTLQALVAAAVASCLVASVLAYPYYFPFRNVLSSGRAAYTLVNDSNVDWNQSAAGGPALRRAARPPRSGGGHLWVQQPGGRRAGGPAVGLPEARGAGSWAVGGCVGEHASGWALLPLADGTSAGGDRRRQHVRVPASGGNTSRGQPGRTAASRTVPAVRGRAAGIRPARDVHEAVGPSRPDSGGDGGIPEAIRAGAS